MLIHPCSKACRLSSVGKRNSTPSRLVLGSEQISLPDLCYESVLRDCDSLSLIQGITMVLCIDGTLLTRPGEQEVETLLDLLLKRLCIRKWEIKAGETVQCLSLDSPEPT